MQNLRYGYPSEYVERDGYSGDWYIYYNDLTPAGEWFYSLDYYDCNNLFCGCPWLRKFAAKLENVSSISYCFQNCQNLEAFYTPSKLKECQFSFESCTKLKEFDADLSELNNGYCMFGNETYNCTSLNVESVENIANSIGSNGGELYIGMTNGLQWDNGDGNYTRCQAALQKIRDKGWTVYEIYSENY